MERVVHFLDIELYWDLVRGDEKSILSMYVDS